MRRRGKHQQPIPFGISRRTLLKGASIGAVGLVIPKVATAAGERVKAHPGHNVAQAHFGNISKGEVDLKRFDPSKYLYEFDYGRKSSIEGGRTVRTYDIVATDINVEVAPGVEFAAWAYNGKVPGPTLRATEGDLCVVNFTNAGSHPHTIHFHGFHSAIMDGAFEQVPIGGKFTYSFVAEPFGLHLYHCHTPPLRKHIHKGLYGTFIIDPPGGRSPANEMVMMMNAFDTNFDGSNEVYAVNTVAHHFMRHPIQIKAGDLQRVYLVNITEFDPVNSFHSHATFFNEYKTGTRLEPNAFTDTILLGQGERSILEFSYKQTGLYMFHAHVSEFAELGWTGMFEVI